MAGEGRARGVIRCVFYWGPRGVLVRQRVRVGNVFIESRLQRDLVIKSAQSTRKALRTRRTDRSDHHRDHPLVDYIELYLSP